MHSSTAVNAYVMAGSRITVSYAELEARSNQLAHLFRDLGLKRGDGIALCLDNHPWFLTLCWAAFRSGLYFTAISYRLQPKEVEYIVNDCGAGVFVTSHALTDTYLGLRDSLRPGTGCFMLDGTAAGAESPALSD